jgi:DNA-binding NarL/FixJ family response regulator
VQISTTDSFKLKHILLIDSDEQQREELAAFLRQHLPDFHIICATELNYFFSCLYAAKNIEILIFDFASKDDLQDIFLIKTLAPQVRLMNWTRCQHPEILEQLYQAGVRCFCSKDSSLDAVLISLLIALVEQHLCLDGQLLHCLPWLSDNQSQESKEE